MAVPKPDHASYRQEIEHGLLLETGGQQIADDPADNRADHAHDRLLRDRADELRKHDHKNGHHRPRRLSQSQR